MLEEIQPLLVVEDRVRREVLGRRRHRIRVGIHGRIDVLVALRALVEPIYREVTLAALDARLVVRDRDVRPREVRLRLELDERCDRRVRRVLFLIADVRRLLDRRLPGDVTLAGDVDGRVERLVPGRRCVGLVAVEYAVVVRVRIERIRIELFGPFDSVEQSVVVGVGVRDVRLSAHFHRVTKFVSVRIREERRTSGFDLLGRGQCVTVIVLGTVEGPVLVRIGRERVRREEVLFNPIAESVVIRVSRERTSPECELRERPETVAVEVRATIDDTIAALVTFGL
ncbi:hypothetical protein [Halosimplex amylolyticum]|uniref:hypothetical protein n=1 Tax=Halosimplex amylolyticum TaxID=3396616 RepID=UPI003F552F1A